MKEKYPIVKDDGKGNLEINCSYCGKPITHSNEFGMFCDDECGMEESKNVMHELDDALSQLGEMLENNCSVDEFGKALLDKLTPVFCPEKNKKEIKGE
jgi:hypothetical protein